MAEWEEYFKGGQTVYVDIGDGTGHHKGEVVRELPNGEIRVKVLGKGMFDRNKSSIKTEKPGEESQGGGVPKMEAGADIQAKGNPKRKGRITEVTQRTVYVKWSDGRMGKFPKSEVQAGRHIEASGSGEEQGGFKPGDRVESARHGKGTVKVAKVGDSVGVEYDKKQDDLHNLGGEAKSGHGYWEQPSILKKIEEGSEEKSDELKIGDKVTLKDTSKFAHQKEEWGYGDNPTAEITGFNGDFIEVEADDTEYKNSYPREDLEKVAEESETEAKETKESDPVEKTADGLYDILRLKETLDKKIDDSVDGELKELREAVKKSQVLEVKQGEESHIVKGLRHKQLDQLIKYASLRLSPLLVGMAGTGKTHAGMQAAEALGLSFYSISVGAQTTKTDIMGYMDAGGRYIRTHFRDAYENGGVFLMDEIDAGNANVLITINAALSNGLAAFPDAMVDRHEDFVFIASANTFGNGANRQYVGRNQLDAATLDRFALIEWFIDDELEENLAVGLYGKAWYKAVRAGRDYVAEKSIRALISPRATQKGSKLLEIGQDVDEVIEATVLGSVPEDKKADVREVIKKVFESGASGVKSALPSSVNPPTAADLLKNIPF